MRLPTGVIGVAHSWHAFSSGAARGEARKGFVSCTWRRLGPLHVAPVGGVALLGSDGFPRLDTSLDEIVGGGVDPKLAAAGDLGRRPSWIGPGVNRNTQRMCGMCPVSSQLTTTHSARPGCAHRLLALPTRPKRDVVDQVPGHDRRAISGAESPSLGVRRRTLRAAACLAGSHRTVCAHHDDGADHGFCAHPVARGRLDPRSGDRASDGGRNLRRFGHCDVAQPVRSAVAAAAVREEPPAPTASDMIDSTFSGAKNLAGDITPAMTWAKSFIAV